MSVRFEPLLILSWLPLVAVIAASWVVTSRIYRRLRINHPGVWRDLGSPGLASGELMRVRRDVRRFLSSDAARRLSDPELDGLLKWRSRLAGLGGAAVLLWLVAILVARYLGRS